LTYPDTLSMKIACFWIHWVITCW